MEKARDVLKDAQGEKAWKNSVELWTARIYLELRANQRDEARKVLDEAKRTLGDRVLLLMAEARLLADTDGKGAEAAIERLADKVSQFPKEEDQARLLSGLADVQLNLEHVKAVRELWRRVAKMPSRRTDLSLHLLLFDLAIKAEDEDDMRRTLTDIRNVEGSQGPFHRYGEALRLIWQAKKLPAAERQKTLDEARVHLDRVQSLRPTWTPLLLARAGIEQLSDRPDQAISRLQEAVLNGERSSAVIRDLVELLANAERFQEADEALRYLREPAFVNSELGRLATVLAAHRKDTKRMLDLMGKNRAAGDGKDYRELLWEGRLLAEANRPEAEQKLRQALKLADKEPEPYVALVQFLVRQKREKEADALLEQARKRLPVERVELTLGQCYEVLGRKKSAQARYEEALNGNRRDAQIVRRVAGFYWNAGQMVEAEPLLRDIADKRVKDPTTEDVNWAALAPGAGPGQWHRLRPLPRGPGAGRTEAGRQRTAGPRRRRHARRQHGRQAFSSARAGLAGRASPLSPARPRTAGGTGTQPGLTGGRSLHPGHDLRGRGIVAEVQAHPHGAGAPEREPAPRHLAYLVQALVEHKELEEADKMAERLEELETLRGSGPNSFAAVELRARLLEEQGKGDAALRRLKDHVKRPTAKPEEVLLVLNSMRRQKKLAEAFDLCAATWAAKKCSAEVIGGASVAVLRNMQANGTSATNAQMVRIEDHLKASH